MVFDVSLSEKIVVGEKDVDFTFNFIFSSLFFLRCQLIKCAINKVEVADHSFPENSLGNLSSYGMHELYKFFILFCDKI